MAYDLIIKDANVIDGSGLPTFHGDVAVSGGRIVEIGRVMVGLEELCVRTDCRSRRASLITTLIMTLRLLGTRFVLTHAITASLRL